MRLGVQILSLVIFFVAALTSTAFADDIRVARDEVLIDDNNRCSIREAIINANDDAKTHDDCTAGNGPDTIILLSSERQPATYTLSDAPAAFDEDGDNGLPPITSEIIINGNNSIIERDDAVTCTPTGTSEPGELRIFHITTAGDLTLNQLTVQNGCANGILDANHGGGLFNDGMLMIVDSIINTNIAVGFGGGIFNSPTGMLTIESSTLSNNDARNASGGGFHN